MTQAADFSPTRFIRDAISSRVDRALVTLEARICHSWKMALDRTDVISEPRGNIGAGTLNLFLRQGSGGTVTDIDGTTLIDFCMGYGAQVLGHDHPAVAAALTAQIARGWQLGLPTAAQLDVGRRIAAAAPGNERVAFCSSGSDATLFAVRAARAVTGREGIAVFAGSFHGAHDIGLVGGDATDAGRPDASQHGASQKFHLGAGIPRAIDEITTVLPYGHPSAFDLIRRHRHDLAAVIVEAVRPDAPHLDAGPWLRELRIVCADIGALLILDETATGFRLAYGGAQEALNLSPDLVTYGKALGGGLPLGAIAGRADVMAAFAAGPGQRGIYAASAFATNAISLAASAAFLAVADAERAVLYPSLDRATRRLAEAFTAAATALHVPAAFRHAGSIFRIALAPGPVRGESSRDGAQRAAEGAFATLALNGGVLLQPGLRGFVAAAHDDTQIDRAAAVFATALADLKTDGAFGAPSAR